MTDDERKAVEGGMEISKMIDVMSPQLLGAMTVVAIEVIMSIRDREAPMPPKDVTTVDMFKLFRLVALKGAIDSIINKDEIDKMKAEITESKQPKPTAEQEAAAQAATDELLKKVKGG